jgi:hypothetical protein
MDVEDLVLDYDPEFPAPRFLAAGFEAALKSSAGRLPSTPPWPQASNPIAMPLIAPPPGAADLTAFHGYDSGDVIIAFQTRFDCVTRQAITAELTKVNPARIEARDAIRNTSDPQIPNPTNNIHTAMQEAGETHTKFAAFTIATSVIATWAIIDAEIQQRREQRVQCKATKIRSAAGQRPAHRRGFRAII